MRVTIFSTGGEIPPCFDFCIVTRSYSSCPFLCALVHSDAKGQILIPVSNCSTGTVELPLNVAIGGVVALSEKEGT